MTTCIAHVVVLASTLLIAGVTPAAEKPEPPADLVAETVAPSCVELRWADRSEGALGFRVEWKITGDWKPLSELPPGTTCYRHAGLLGGAGRSYAFRVRAVGAAGESDWATTGPVVTPDPAERPRGTVIVSATPEHPRVSEATMLKLQDGALLLLYGAHVGDTGDTIRARLMQLTSTDGGQSWSQPEVTLEDPSTSIFLPSLVRMASGEIGLAYARLKSGAEAVKVFRYSADEGKSWSPEQQISTDDWGYSTGSHDRFVRLSNDRLLITVHVKRGQGGLGTYVLTSDDNGRTWSRSPEDELIYVPANPTKKHEHGFWEASVVEHAPGNLLMFGRTATGWFWECRSDDFGSTWSAPQQSGIRAPLTPPVLPRIPGSQTIVLLHNPRTEMQEGWHGGERVMLVSLLSDDGGCTWYNYREIEYLSPTHWFDYPAHYWTGDTLHLAYRSIPDGGQRWQQVHLGYIALDKAWFTRAGCREESDHEEP